MTQRIQLKLPLWLNATLLSLLPPLFLSSSIRAQECTQKQISANIEQFKNTKTLKAAHDALVQCDSKAVPPLVEALSDSNAAIRGNAASTLGKMGWSAQDAVPELVEALGDSDEAVRRNSVTGLIAIGRSAQKRANTLSELDLGAIQELEALKQQIEKAVSRLDAKPQEWTKQKQEWQELRLTRNALQTKLNHLKERALYRYVQWVSQNPGVWLLLAGLGYFGIYALRPLWLLQLDKVLQSQTVKLPVVNLEVPLQKMLIFKYRPRVLDVWVNKHLDSVQREFLAKTIVQREHNTYVPLPVNFNGKILIPVLEVNEDNATGKPEEPEHKQLQLALQERMANDQQFCLLIQGEGGAGKTSLACQIALWGMKRKLGHPILPVLIDQELQENENFLEVIRKQLQDLTNTEDEDISTEYLKNLLRQRRILVIIDHFSEMGKPVRNQVFSALREFPIINALVVTSRLEEDLPNKLTLKPMRLEKGRILGFLSEYLRLHGKLDLFEDADAYQACARLDRMVGQRNITILFAKLYADQMIAVREGNTGFLPENIPELMLSYLNQLNPNADYPKQLTVHRDAKALSWKCLEQTYRPAPVLREVAVAALAEIDPNDPNTRLQDLEKSLLVQKVEPDKIRINLDPIAEYLAGLHLVQKYKDNAAVWEKLLNEIDDKSETPEAVEGFLLAVWDCCELKKKELNIPDFVIEQLLKKANLDADKIMEAQRRQRIKLLINELSAPEVEYRSRAVIDLGAMAEDVTALKLETKSATQLRKILDNESEVAKIRMEAAKALKQFREDIPMLIAKIENGVELIRLVESLPSVQIDLGDEVKLEMVEIPSGTFLMGAPLEEESSDESERPQHEVTLEQFMMGKYPVTQAQWQAVVSMPKVERELDPDLSFFKDPTSSVDSVSWHDTVEFCARLTQHTGRAFRLPSEAEWEYACRAGTTTPFHFGETISTILANYNGRHSYGNGSTGDYRAKTMPVESFLVANVFGLYELHGNIWEICADTWHDNYCGAPTDGSAWIDDHNDERRVLRGGSWYYYPDKCRSAFRNYIQPHLHNGIGFRVVCSGVAKTLLTPTAG